MMFLIVIHVPKALADQHEHRILEKEIIWQLTREEEGIKVYLGDWPGSEFAAFRSETELGFSLDTVLTLVLDIEGYKEWMPDCRESLLLAKVDENRFNYYVLMNSPWPLSDRDWVNRLEIEADALNKSLKIVYRAFPGILDEKPGVIRVHKHYALWILTPIGRNRVRSVWYGHSEPEGWIPSWLTRFTIDQMIVDTTLNMRKQLSRIENR